MNDGFIFIGMFVIVFGAIIMAGDPPKIEVEKETEKQKPIDPMKVHFRKSGQNVPASEDHSKQGYNITPFPEVNWLLEVLSESEDNL